MEYEIEDEAVLFDDSTNPSLKQRTRQPVPPRPRAQVPAPQVQRRKAVTIPEEEPVA